MVLIRDIVKSALRTGYLSLDSQEHLDKLLQGEFEEQDIDALMMLDEAVNSGRVRKESAKAKSPVKTKAKKGVVKMKLVCESAFASVIVATIVFAVPNKPQTALMSEQGNPAQMLNTANFGDLVGQ
jgi:mannose/fructose/N-acetylgalactosamine-specific phosphotransferase system component IIB